MLALIDCNNFYVSCERVFRPQLEHTPVIVLSSNDGCVVSASAEVKSWGVYIGQPFFQLKHLVEKHQIKVFSSNFALYGDMSARVMSLVQPFGKAMEVYSIDEAFLDVSLIPVQQLFSYAQEMVSQVKSGTGIPISIGVAPTKTLAKIANHMAKKTGQKTQQSSAWVYALDSSEKISRLLGQISIEQVWGIGREGALKLKKDNIHTARDLANADLAWLKKRFNITLERIARELRGQRCFELEATPTPRKQIIVSRSFGTPQTQYVAVRSALSHFVTRAAEKLREEHLICRGMTVFAKFKSSGWGESSHYLQESVCLPQATDNTTELLSFALSCLSKIFNAQQAYKKAGVILYDFMPAIARQGSLFKQPAEQYKSERLMGVLDNINQKFGQSRVRYGSEGTIVQWAPKRMLQSPSYTTCWSQLLVVKAV